MLILDVGNTSVRIAEAGVAGPGGARAAAGVAVRRIEDHPTPRSESARRALAKRLLALAADHPGSPALVSVEPAVTAGLSEALPGLIVVDHRSRLPFAVAMPDPAAVGADRYCNVAAATACGWRDALIVDIGTATTFDLLSEGTFAGGLIAPGPAFAADRLGERAARLKPVPLAPCPLEAGLDTAAAMRAGAWHVGLRGIRYTIADLIAAYGPRPVVLSGGLAPLIAGELPSDPGFEWTCDPDWTLRGLAVIAADSA